MVVARQHVDRTNRVRAQPRPEHIFGQLCSAVVVRPFRLVCTRSRRHVSGETVAFVCGTCVKYTIASGWLDRSGSALSAFEVVGPGASEVPAPPPAARRRTPDPQGSMRSAWTDDRRLSYLATYGESMATSRHYLAAIRKISWPLSPHLCRLLGDESTYCSVAGCGELSCEGGVERGDLKPVKCAGNDLQSGGYSC